MNASAAIKMRNAERSRSGAGSIRVVAHRGASAAHADNSWAAFKAALIDGADAIECDVQATRDGVLVVRHDLDLDSRLVADMTATAVAAREPDVVLFDELIDWAERVDIDLLVEVKEPGVTSAVATTIAAGAWSRHCVVGSFHGPALAAAKARTPDVRTSFMMGSVARAEELIALAKVFGVDGIHLCWESRAARPHRLLDAATVQQLRRAGLSVTLWHEERADEIEALCALEPDAICSDTPAVLRRIVDSKGVRERAPHNGGKQS